MDGYERARMPALPVAPEERRDEVSASILPAWEPYRPSNGTEGQFFMEEWCLRCARDAAFRNDKPEHGCRILARTLLYDIDDPNYPKEWVRRSNDNEWPGSARCTAFVSQEELSKRARRAWQTRRERRRASCRDLFDPEKP
jgi:hypothetical protein